MAQLAQFLMYIMVSITITRIVKRMPGAFDITVYQSSTLDEADGTNATARDLSRFSAEVTDVYIRAISATNNWSLVQVGRSALRPLCYGYFGCRM